MGKFEISYPLTKKSEGGWTKDPNDSGNSAPLGTYCGITQRDYPLLLIWIFLAKQTYIFGKIFTELNDQVTDFYKEEFWDKLRLDEVEDQATCNMTFDMSVNKGKPIAIEYAQEAAGIAMTGVMDDATINGLNNPIV
jgi:lysozyme family protein